jgi:hypothetical protein
LLAAFLWKYGREDCEANYSEYRQTFQHAPNRIADSPGGNPMRPSVLLHRTPTGQPSLLHPIV